MKEKIFASFLVAILLSTITIQAVKSETQVEIVLKPFRAVVVIDIDWGSDPQSYVESTVWAFHDVVTLLKLWSIPFDILRLDNNILNITQFVDAEGKPKYGVIIWNCRQDRFDPANPEYVGKGTRDWSVLETAVINYGISLITLANTILEPRIRDILGINFIDLSSSVCWYRMTEGFVITGDHFITRGYNGTIIEAGDYGVEGTMGGYGSRVGFDSSKTTVLGSQGQWPQLAIRDLSESTKAVWIGGNRDVVFSQSPIMENILRRAITYCMGYSLYKTYPNTILLRIDDMGCSQEAYLPAWHYSQLTKEQIESSIIQPLVEHNATLAVMYLTGYPRHIEQAVLESWTLDWVDPYGTRQNLTSNYLGILEGISQGVLEIQSHGWTHMQPDLVSPPGPWWDNPGGTEWSNEGWYREFYDTRRGEEIDVATQELHFDYSIQYTQEAFDTFPLSFAPGGDAISGRPSEINVPATYTYKLAALEGFGLASDANGYYYLGPPGDIVISQMRMTRTYYLNRVSDIRTRLKAYGGWDIPIMLVFHDRDIVLDPGYLDTYLNQLEAPATSTENAVQDYMSNNEFIGYLHAKPSALSSTLGFAFEYDSHYCKYFATNNSTWTLQLSDSMLAKFRNLGKIDIMVDGTYKTTIDASTYFSETQTLTIPQGIGTHTIQFAENHDIAIINVIPSTTTAVAGTSVPINVTVKNEGSVTETLNVTAYYDNNKIGTQTVTNLVPEVTTTLTFNWNTSTLLAGTYTIKATASTVPGEIDTADNTYVDGIIRIVELCQPFTIIVLPDTQYYSESYPTIFDNQTQWIVDNVASMNILFVLHEGDIANNDVTAQWVNANGSMGLLDDHVPWAVLPGNHDGTNVGTLSENLNNYNTYFPYSRFSDETWYGGAYNNINTNSFTLFSGGEDDYIIFNFQYHPSDAVLAWANTTITAYPNRRAIVVTHDYLDTDGTRTTEGNHIWNNFASHHADQIFLVLCGHMHGEARRQDTVNGHIVYQVLADYQERTNGGDGWLRILEFHPAEDKIYVKTFTPYHNSYETDANSQFTLNYDMSTQRQTKISISTHTSYGFVGIKVNISGTLTDLEQTGIANATVVLSYTFPDTSEWISLTSATTDPQGNYNVMWVPQATGYFTLKVEWSGNETYLGSSNSTTLNVVSYEDKYIFSVASNSTVSALMFNSTSLELSFTVTGPSGTAGFTQVTLAKTLVADITNLKVYLDGTPLEYSTGSTDDSWIIYFTYSHSTHRITIVINPMVERTPTSFLPTNLFLLLAIVTLILATSFYKRSSIKAKIRRTSICT
jgi:hypothetical protein